MKLSELQAGTKLELEPLYSDGIKLEHSLASEFEWAVDDNAAVIAAPINEGVVFPIHTGTELYVYILLRKERETGIFRFKAVVTGRETSENLALLRIEAAGEIKRIQRRQYYRLDCSLPVQYRVVGSMNPLVNESVPFKKTLACDISGGGVCLLLEDKAEAGRLVECEMTVGEEKTVKFYGRITRYYRSDTEGKYRYKAGVAYVKISESDREAVVRFIFNEQRKLRKKGLI